MLRGAAAVLRPPNGKALGNNSMTSKIILVSPMGQSAFLSNNVYH